MWCTKCEKELSNCICIDLRERLQHLKSFPTLIIPNDVMEKYEKQASRNKDEQTIQE
jgi:hypothetical protein